LKGVDPGQAGTKNVGATNALVVAGPVVGALALIGDIAKGYLAIQLARYFNFNDGVIALAGLVAILGHDFPLFLKFRGGKGVATTGGVLFALDPIFAFLVILLWVFCMIVFRYFIPATILALGFLPLIMWMASWRTEYIFFGVGAFSLALYVHRKDIQRFFAGEELTIQESLAKHLKK
jgi:glycerol-3-phosphate acyltransferase PlsY